MEKISKDVATFKLDLGIKVIVGISGGADVGLNDDAPDSVRAYHDDLMRSQIKEVAHYFGDYRIALLCGGTKFGVPAAAAHYAKEADIPTIGVFPTVGKKHALPSDRLDLSICVPPGFGESAWGDESPVFAKLLDGVIVYGGGTGTLIEAAHILKCNESLIKNRRPPKFIAPIGGSGGTADILPYFSGKPKVRASCMPQWPLDSGRSAAEWIEKRLNLFDYRR